MGDEADEKDPLVRWFDDSTDDDSDSECYDQPKKSILEEIKSEFNII